MRHPSSLLVGLVLALAGTGCLATLPFDEDGFACTVDGECGGGLCLGGTCRREDWQPPFPVRVAHYAHSYAYSWGACAVSPCSKYEPCLGYYRTRGDSGTVSTHHEALIYGNVDVAMTSWWGQAADSDEFINDALATVGDRPLRWVLRYEDERSAPVQPVVDILANLRYLARTVGYHPGYFRVDRRWVLFVHVGTGDDCGTLARWKEANEEVGAYLVFERVANHLTCAAQPDAWYDEAPTQAQLSVPPHMFAVSPGYFEHDEVSPALGRDLVRFRSDVETMVESLLPFQMVDSFNHWMTGTSVECATTWTSASGQGSYLDVLHEVPTR